MESQNWRTNGSSYFVNNKAMESDSLPPAVYNIAVDSFGNMFLEQSSKLFEMPAKMYGLETEFVSRVFKTYESKNNENIGILLSGLKGTGKTITSKIILNTLIQNYKVPVIVVSRNYNGWTEWIDNINQPIAILIDEYEKIVESTNRNDEASAAGFLRFLENMPQGNRRITLMTSNNSNVYEYLISRPGRVRYHKQFGNMQENVVKEIIEDLLLNKEFEKPCLEYIMSLANITIDNIKAIIEEVNIHQESPEAFKDIINISRYTPDVYVYYVQAEGDSIYDKGSVLAGKFNRGCSPDKRMRENGQSTYYVIGNPITNVNNKYLGEVVGIIDPDTYQIELEYDLYDCIKADSEEYFPIEEIFRRRLGGLSFIKDKTAIFKQIEEHMEEHMDCPKISYIVKLEERQPYNPSFRWYNESREY